MERVRRVLMWQPFPCGTWQAAAFNLALMAGVFSLSTALFGGPIAVWAWPIAVVGLVQLAIALRRRGRSTPQ